MTSSVRGGAYVCYPSRSAFRKGEHSATPLSQLLVPIDDDTCVYSLLQSNWSRSISCIQVYFSCCAFSLVCSDDSLGNTLHDQLELEEKRLFYLEHPLLNDVYAFPPEQVALIRPKGPVSCSVCNAREPALSTFRRIFCFRSVTLFAQPLDWRSWDSLLRCIARMLLVISQSVLSQSNFVAKQTSRLQQWETLPDHGETLP